MANLVESYLGVALKFPIDINQFGTPNLVFGRDAVNQSIVDILSTPYGTRYFQATYGSKLSQLYFVQNDSILKSLLINYISDALGNWEKRIQVLGVSVNIPQPSQADCNISYKILQSSQVDSFIYPYYREIKY